MSCGDRKIVDNSKSGGGKKESQRAIEKEENTSTEFPEGGNTTSIKDTPPGIPMGWCTQCANENVMGKAISSDNPVIYC